MTQTIRGVDIPREDRMYVPSLGKVVTIGPGQYSSGRDEWYVDTSEGQVRLSNHRDFVLIAEVTREQTINGGAMPFVGDEVRVTSANDDRDVGDGWRVTGNDARTKTFTASRRGVPSRSSSRFGFGKDQWLITHPKRITYGEAVVMKSGSVPKSFYAPWLAGKKSVAFDVEYRPIEIKSMPRAVEDMGNAFERLSRTIAAAELHEADARVARAKKKPKKKKEEYVPPPFPSSGYTPGRRRSRRR